MWEWAGGETRRDSRSISFASSDVLSFYTQPEQWALYDSEKKKKKLFVITLGRKRRLTRMLWCGHLDLLVFLF
jgi:hypothetical protein